MPENNRESVPQLESSALTVEVEPAQFVLQTVYKGSRETVADGVCFPPPNEQVVVNWRGSGSVELLNSIEDLYDRFGQSPQVMWRHSDGILTEAEPQDLIDSYQ